MRETKLVPGEIYHIFNRGVDKRIIFSDQKDLDRFFKSMQLFNSVQPIGSLHEHSFSKEEKNKLLVNFIAYNLLPNHFHFLLEQVSENGISEFMKRLLGGYTWYFNKKHKRSGSLFQGTFKSKHINSNEYLLHASVYVNLNHKISLNTITAKSSNKPKQLGKSSWEEYVKKNGEKDICKKDVILDQFKSSKEYEKFALSSLEFIRDNKKKYEDLEY